MIGAVCGCCGCCCCSCFSSSKRNEIPVNGNSFTFSHRSMHSISLVGVGVAVDEPFVFVSPLFKLSYVLSGRSLSWFGIERNLTFSLDDIIPNFEASIFIRLHVFLLPNLKELNCLWSKNESSIRLSSPFDWCTFLCGTAALQFRQQKESLRYCCFCSTH